MGSPEFAVGSIIAILLICSLAGVRFGYISAKIAGLVMFLGPVMANLIIVRVQGGNTIEMFCMGTLLSLAFGPATFVAGNYLERIAKQRK